MILAVISMVFMAFSLQYFTLNHDIQGANRVILNTPVQLLSKYVLVVDGIVYFDNDGLEDAMDAYYEDSLSRYVKSYDTTYYFYNLEDHSYSIEAYSRGVDITVTCSLRSGYSFSRSMYYETQEGIYGQA